jgi:phosphoserine phosphatase
MDRVLVNHLSTWQVVYDAIGADNSESFNLYNQGKLDEWTWIKLDLELIEAAFEAMDGSHARVDRLDDILLEAPFMPGLDDLIQSALNAGWKVAIVSGGVQATGTPWKRRWVGIEKRYAVEAGHGCDTPLDVFTNGWLPRLSDDENGRLRRLGRYQVQMNGKGALVRMLQRRYGVERARTVAVGDSAGDIGMFEEVGLPICFNPWDERPFPYAKVVIETCDLQHVIEAITTHGLFKE